MLVYDSPTSSFSTLLIPHSSPAFRKQNRVLVVPAPDKYPRTRIKNVVNIVDSFRAVEGSGNSLPAKERLVELLNKVLYRLVSDLRFRSDYVRDEQLIGELRAGLGAVARAEEHQLRRLRQAFVRSGFVASQDTN